MKHIKSCIVGLSLAINLVYSGAALSATTGSVILRDKDNAICNLPAPAPGGRVIYNLTQQQGCKDWNDRARSFQLAELPSSSFVVFSDNSLNCGISATYYYLLRTIKKQTSTPIIEFEYLQTFTHWQIIKPGLILEYGYSNTNPRDKLTCVEITTSPTP
ncbi:hypothetical protein H7698_16360 [Pseudomonas sp. p50]|uniref:hypothetical protein n=1 Tax=Pseudomonas sp. p50(2008) TaxID=2816832 RepID=UPI00188CE7A1|nr:hypothetical protein [Pseudomonas sp. p50(2008)]MBF4557651.1 hypothetical protein [Pseudomonas sp. p50(2008)]